MVVRVMRLPVTGGLATAMMIAGVAGVVVWRHVLALSGDVFEVLPGMVLGALVYLVGRPRQTR